MNVPFPTIPVAEGFVCESSSTSMLSEIQILDRQRHENEELVAASILAVESTSRLGSSFGKIHEDVAMVASEIDVLTDAVASLRDTLRHRADQSSEIGQLRARSSST
mmetsp:Transcript_10968/g.33816  ORF Transcript_10968/g.33816 Transcript_10968/m.33816 type:complete len:107 (+) Transcript_10968:49-369(+)